MDRIGIPIKEIDAMWSFNPVFFGARKCTVTVSCSVCVGIEERRIFFRVSSAVIRPSQRSCTPSPWPVIVAMIFCASIDVYKRQVI